MSSDDDKVWVRISGFGLVALTALFISCCMHIRVLHEGSTFEIGLACNWTTPGTDGGVRP